MRQADIGLRKTSRVAMNLGCYLYPLATLTHRALVPVGGGILPVRVALREPVCDLLGRQARLQVVVRTVLLVLVRALFGDEHLSAAVGDELDDNAFAREVVVHAGVEATGDVQVGAAVVERSLVEDRCSATILVVVELGPATVASR